MTRYPPLQNIMLRTNRDGELDVGVGDYGYVPAIDFKAPRQQLGWSGVSSGNDYFLISNDMV